MNLETKGESDFKGTEHEAHLLNSPHIEKWYEATKKALELQPNSKYWNDAFSVIEKRFKRLKNFSNRK